MSKKGELAKIKLQKRVAKASLTRFETYMNDDIDPESYEIEEVKIRSAKLDEAYETFTAAQIEIVASDNTASEEEIALESADIEDKYIRLKVAAEKLIKEKLNTSINHGEAERTIIEARDNINNNERLQIPAYNTQVYYLRSSLEGDAAEVVSSLEISGNNYAGAWALQTLNRPADQWDDLLIHIITSKLDIRTIKEWEDTINTTQGPSFTELIEFLKRRCQTLEAVEKMGSINTTNASSRPGSHKVKAKGLCLNCLRGNHLIKDCSSGSCRICSKRHSFLLHIENQKSNLESKASHSSSVELKYSSQVLLSTAVVKIKDKDDQFVNARALLNNGSQSNFILSSLAKKLKLDLRDSPLEIKGIGQQIFKALKIVELQMSSQFESFTRILNSIFQQEINLLIGAEKFWDLLCVGQIKLGNGKPVLQKTLLGWIVAGKLDVPRNNPLSASCFLSCIQELNDTLGKFWQIENVLDDVKLPVEFEHCEEHFKKTYKRNPQGRFIIKLPLKEDAIYHMGHMKVVNDSRNTALRVLLPHQPVINESSATTKVRVVFDASSKSSKEISLNDTLHKGPTIQSDLFSILLKFRCFR
ncbi:PREDICTED: uncharacterized protein LOC105461663, partial [Wasmannia auropunctata]|uniref:uncharacterized protein LOC105461663 n=1 Tax=Wasmannia auropunctata TaxID=64793 RepID=UPI0005EF6858